MPGDCPIDVSAVGRAVTGGQCFGAGTPVARGDGSRVAIEDVGLGDRVQTWFSGEPGYAAAMALPDTEIDPARTRVVWFAREEGDGLRREVGLLRSLDWMADEGIGEVGDRVALDLPEMDVSGEFQVVAIEPCPEIETGPGRGVTGVFRHSHGRVYHLHVTGEPKPIRVTANHPCWSLDRKDWVTVRELRIGERLAVQGGSAVVLGLEALGEEAVFNLEVDADHCYRIGQQGVLVHNDSLNRRRARARARARRASALRKQRRAERKRRKAEQRKRNRERRKEKAEDCGCAAKSCPVKKGNPPKKAGGSARKQRGQCFGARTAVWRGDGTRAAIEDVELGDRVRTWHAGEPGYAEMMACADTAINPARTRAVWFVREEDGLRQVVGLLRSVEWLVEEGIGRVGDTAALDLPEMDVSGAFQVVAIDPCPRIAAGLGRLVTGVFHHGRGRVYNLRVEGEPEPLRVTGNHPFWSGDRNDWVPVSALGVGERLAVEGGTTGVVGLDEAGEEPVFNLEVDADHCYRVGEQGILVHNTSPSCKACKKLGNPQQKTIRGQGGNTFVSVYQAGVNTKGKVFTYKTAGLKSSGQGSDDPVVCRVNKITGTLAGRSNNRTGRQKWPQDLMRRALLVGSSFANNYDAGHLIGLAYGGPDSTYALVPQDRQTNQGELDQVSASGTSGWTSKDNKINECLGQSSISGATISVMVAYNNTGDKINIPSWFNVKVVFTRTGRWPAMGGPTLTFDNAPDFLDYFGPANKCLSQWRPL